MTWKMQHELSLNWFLKGLDRFIITKDAALSQNLFNVVVMMGGQNKNQEALDLVLSVSKKIPARHPQDKIFYSLSIAMGYLGTRAVCPSGAICQRGRTGYETVGYSAKRISKIHAQFVLWEVLF